MFYEYYETFLVGFNNNERLSSRKLPCRLICHIGNKDANLRLTNG